MKKLASLLFVILTFAGLAFAQAVPAAVTQPSLKSTDYLFTSTKHDWRVAPYVVGTITTAPGAAGQNYTIGLGIEHDGDHTFLDASGVYSTAAVALNPGQPHVGVFTLQGYYKIAGHLLVGGGATTVLNTGAFKTPKVFVDSARSQSNPFVGTGLEFGRFRTIASYQIPVRGEGVPEQIKFNLDNTLALNKYIRVGVPLTISSYETAPLKSLGGARVSIAQVGGKLQFIF